MSSVGFPELLIIALVVVLIFGASQLPKLARSVGQAQKEFKKGLKEGAAEDDEDATKDEGQASS
ncbi:MAG: twin-arginine translocase TatA/TatE family subunit [Acidimicrobiia bacterium]